MWLIRASLRHRQLEQKKHNLHEILGKVVYRTWMINLPIDSSERAVRSNAEVLRYFYHGSPASNLAAVD
ncbi:unnamed protein product [Amoebophrya sp. A120]|nr:unnamed protein product [Amoebophrya sp. A120]|eukprot:GSA120T00020530001.1